MVIGHNLKPTLLDVNMHMVGVVWQERSQQLGPSWNFQLSDFKGVNCAPTYAVSLHLLTAVVIRRLSVFIYVLYWTLYTT